LPRSSPPRGGGGRRALPRHVQGTRCTR
jgi:hypothetical protein